MLDDRARPLLHDLPLPLAQLLLRALNAKSAVEHHHCAFYLLEAGIKLAAAARVGLFLEVADADDPLLPSLAKVGNNPSTGHWRGLLRDLDRALADRPAVVDHPLVRALPGLSNRRLPAVHRFVTAAAEHHAVGSEVRRTAVRGGIDGFLDAVVAYRNEVLGHGAQRDERFYEAIGPLLLAAALELLETDALVGGLSLVAPTAAVESGQAVLGWTGLTGLAGLPIRAPVSTGPAASGRLYLAGGPALVPLHPLVVWSRPSGDPLGRVGFLNRTVHRASGDGRPLVKRAEYLDYTTGQALPDVDCRTELAELLARVGGLLAPDLPSEVDEPPGQATFADPDPTPLQSRAIVGDFELLGELGRGGMGVVWRARQLGLGRIVALKVLSLELAADPVARDRFRREIQALARSDHPNVVRVLSHGEEDGQLYYAMEYVDGTDLSHTSSVLSGWRSHGVALQGDSLGQVAEQPDRPRRTLEGSGETLFRRLASLFAEVASGVQHLHERGVVHRDLKPANLMMTANGRRLVIADLGLARIDDATRALTASNVKILGTLRYMSPEQLQRNLLEVDGRADIYALGVTLTELCTGRPFFDGDTEQRLIQQVLNEEPVAPHVADPSLPMDLSLVLQKATAKRADDRYADAAAFAADLAAFASDRPVSVRAPGMWRRSAMVLRRNPVLGAYLKMSASFLLVVTLVGAAVLGFGDRIRGDRVRLYSSVDTKWGAVVGTSWLAHLDHVAWPLGPLAALGGVFDPAHPMPRYEIEFDGGLATRVVHRGPDGTPVPTDTSAAIQVQTFDTDGRISQVRSLDPDGNVLSRVLFDWTDTGGEVWCDRIYQSGAGAPAPDPYTGVFVERIWFDALGNRVRTLTFDADRRPMADVDGDFGYAQRRDDSGVLLQTDRLDADGTVRLAHHRIRTRSRRVVDLFRDGSGRPVRGPDGVHAIVHGESRIHEDRWLDEARAVLGARDPLDDLDRVASAAYLEPDNQLRAACAFTRTYLGTRSAGRRERLRLCLDAAGALSDAPDHPAITITRYGTGEAVVERFDASGRPHE
ncbi:MAG: serine/threonine-protein kinase [Myxococcota bacterium]